MLMRKSGGARKDNINTIASNMVRIVKSVKNTIYAVFSIGFVLTVFCVAQACIEGFIFAFT